MSRHVRVVWRGDLDKIAQSDIGIQASPRAHWTDESIHQCRTRYLEGRGPGRDCPACTAPRAEHDAWGNAATGCQLSIALITGGRRG